MKYLHIFSVFLFSLLLSCSSSKKSTVDTYGGGSYNKLFIIANTADIEVRVRLEKEFAIAAESKEYKVIKSIDILPISLNDPKPPPKEEFVNKVKASGCDALFVVYFLKKGDEVRHIPGVNFKGTDPWLTGLVGMLLVGNKEFNKHSYDNKSDPGYTKTISDPGFYTKEKAGFYIVSELIDAATEQIIYSEKSELFDEENLVLFSRGYMAALVNQLEIKKILKK